MRKIVIRELTLPAALSILAGLLYQYWQAYFYLEEYYTLENSGFCFSFGIYS